MLHFKYKSIDSANTKIQNLLLFAIGNPKNIQKELEIYNQENHYILGCFDGSDIIGMIGIEKQDSHAIIKHISVLLDYREKAIGRYLILEAIQQFSLKRIEAETDTDAVNFYRKSGFICQEFEGKYGNSRYKCIWVSK